MRYDVDYFIEFFSARPANQWAVRTFCDARNRRCAVGHCVTRELPGYHAWDAFRASGLKLAEETRDRLMVLAQLFNHDDYKEGERMIQRINNGDDPRYKQKTPRARILAALHDIKAKAESAMEAYEDRPLIQPTRELAGAK